MKTYEDNLYDIYLKAFSPENTKAKKTKNLDKKINMLKGYCNTIDPGKVSINKLNSHSVRIKAELKSILQGYKQDFSDSGLKVSAKKSYESNKALLDKITRLVATLDFIYYENYTGESDSYPSIDVLLAETSPLLIRTQSLVEIYEYTYLSTIVKKQIEEVIEPIPQKNYPLARQMHRHFIIHVGGTNTGKTYQALLRLKQADSGVFLSPLRLLALEVQENLLSDKIPCTLLTGEEESIIQGAKHIASTVEKLNTEELYDVCVIDECQMLQDIHRGSFWSKAILGVRAHEIHCCMAPEALNIVIKLIKDCNDTYEVIEHKRNTPLTFISVPNILDNLEPGDALVVFSKKSALALSSFLYDRGIKASIIYGALPYNTRKKQLQRFLDKETDIVIATDAIGMGLNLPIKRIIFAETEKFDGVEVRVLKPDEIKQIAGRAGRKGIYEEGFVTSVSNMLLIKEGLDTENKEIKSAYVPIPEKLFTTDFAFVDVLKTWQASPTEKHYKKPNITNMIALTNRLEDVIDINSITKMQLYKLVTIPFDEKRQEVLDLWLDYTKEYFRRKVNELEFPMPTGIDLLAYETYYKSLDLYYSFSKTFNLSYDKELLVFEKERVANIINNLLLEGIEKHGRTCRICGKRLTWDYPYKICQSCFNKRKFHKEDVMPQTESKYKHLDSSNRNFKKKKK